MPKYLYAFKYTNNGLQGLLKEGGSGRKAADEQLAGSMGGKVDAFYYAWGDIDGYLIVDLPDDASAAAISLAVSSAGAVTISTTPLITPEEMDAATQKHPDYRPPGS
jgi:uncharacterized protein with GYD domain